MARAIHGRIIRDERELARIREYIVRNPLTWEPWAERIPGVTRQG